MVWASIDFQNGQKYIKITFPILSPKPTTVKYVHFLKYPIYVGRNRGRGHIYPIYNSKSNNNVYNATTMREYYNQSVG